MVSDLKEKLCEVFLKSADMLEEIKKLRNEDGFGSEALGAA